MDTDICIIGSGVGGGAVALTLADSGARIAILERGERLPREAQNTDPTAVFIDRRYRAKESWVDGNGASFTPGQYYFVGGHTKFYGTAMFRLREQDFEATEHEDGVSPAWPLSYRELEPYYAEAAFVGLPLRADPARAADRCSRRQTASTRLAPFPHAFGDRSSGGRGLHSLWHLRCVSLSARRER